MANAVFTAKLNPNYDDAVEERYHFPKQYLARVREAVGDWIVYYESRRDGGRQVYFATARVAGLQPDLAAPGHYYALISEYVEFPEPVPFRFGGELLESFLRNKDGTTNPGAAINAVRAISNPEFHRIVELGMARAIDEIQDGNAVLADGFAVAEPQAEYAGNRPTSMVSRPVRDAAFSRIVRLAYERTCAMTGLQLINGGGRCEIEAAHIRPVEDAGPDSPRNGIALSRTVHWLFDRGFLSIADDGAILQARNRVPDPVRRMLNPDLKIRPPMDRSLAPHAVFLKYHRERKFKG